MKLFFNEIKHIYKQSLLFITIAMILFTLSISVLCFSIDMIEGYKKYLNNNLEIAYLNVSELDDIEKYQQLNNYSDYLFADASGVTFYPKIKQGDIQVEQLMGRACLFRDSLPYGFQDCIFNGRCWSSNDNIKTENATYSIFLAQTIADELSLNYGEEIIFEYLGKDGWQTCFMTVAGIYNENDYISDDFFIPLDFILEIKDKLRESLQLYLEFSTPSNMISIYPKLSRMSCTISSVYVSLDEINLINSMRYILICISIIVLIITFLVLNNALTITINSRKKYMAKLKLLGATTNKVTVIYYAILILSFIFAFSLAVLLSFYLCGYFSFLAKYVINYPITICLHWEACLGLFVGSCLLLTIRYFLFRKKIKSIIPLTFIKEE